MRVLPGCEMNVVWISNFNELILYQFLAWDLRIKLILTSVLDELVSVTNEDTRLTFSVKGILGSKFNCPF